jgi:Protein of unknown function (DUF707)
MKLYRYDSKFQLVIYLPNMMQFLENSTILLFHYDGRVNEWDEFEWSQQSIHISTRKQAKW